MLALIVGASPQPGGSRFYTDLLARADLVVAADAGAEWCVGLGRVPHLAVGDFDSAAPGAAARLRAAGARVLEHLAAKDDSDLDLAVSAALAQGASGITMCACSGGRLDHTLASVGTLLRAARSAAADLQEPSFAAWAVEGPSRPCLELSMGPGATFSVFAVGEASGVSVQGGVFPLEDETLPSLSSLGLSNVASQRRIAITVMAGSIVVIAQVSPGAERPALMPTP